MLDVDFKRMTSYIIEKELTTEAVINGSKYC